MAIQTSSKTPALNLTQHELDYRLGYMSRRTYDLYASPLNKTLEPRGATTQIQWATALVPRPTGAIGSETTDFEPQTWIDTTNTITKVYIADGFKRHELQELKSSANIARTNAFLVGELMMNTVEGIARRAITEGGVVYYGDGTHTTRATLDLGTANDHLTWNNFALAYTILANWSHVGNGLLATITPFQYADLIGTGTGNIFTNRASYTNEKDVLSDFEVGKAAGFRIMRSPLAKRFYGAGAANASAVSTTLATSTTANLAGAKTIEVAANTNIAAGMWLTVGTVQTSTESDDTLITEAVQVVSISSTTITIAGSGPGGGLMYTHAVGATVKNNDTVHAAIFGGSESMAVVYDAFGRYGQMVPPFEDGNAKQWKTYSFKYWGNYGIMDNTQVLRLETSGSYQ